HPVARAGGGPGHRLRPRKGRYRPAMRTFAPYGFAHRRPTPVPAITASTPADYQLPVVGVGQRRFARAWLGLGMLALVGSGLFSILLVLARTPVVGSWLPAGDFFRVALVVHVDLSVLVWFVAMAGLLWSLDLRDGRGARPMGQAALALCGGGAFVMALAAFVEPGTPVMSNYIPVLDSATFLAGLAAFGIGALLLVARGFLHARPVGVAIDGRGALRFGLHASLVATAVALLAFALSVALAPRSLPAQAYYEILWWGGGHALQFTWTLLMLVAWLALAHACGGRVPLSPRIVLLMFLLALASVFVTPLAYLVHEIGSVEHREMHTWGMRLGGGLAIAPIALAVLLAIGPLRRLDPERRPLRAALLASMLLFVAGGVIGLAIDGNNVKIPAHYHG